MRRGEIIFVALIALVGAAWALLSLNLSYLEDGVPSSGYFPFWIGLLVVILATLYVAFNWRSLPKDDAGDEPDNWRRPALVTLGLLLCVAVLDYVGFGLAVAAYLLFLLTVLEKVRWPVAGGVAVGISAFIIVLFHMVLSVPLPAGPWGF